MPRSEERTPYLQEVELEFASGRRTARISDISPGGCFVDTIAQVPAGEIVSLHLVGASGEAGALRGRVAYVLENFGFGVEFVDLTDEQKQLIESLTGQLQT